MFCRAAGALATLAIGANAFLIPAGVGSFKSDDSLSTIVNPRTQTIKLPCPDCVFPSKSDDQSVEADEENGGLFWAQGGARDVVLNFTIADDSRAVMINDFQVYPITMDSSENPTVGEVAASASLTDIKEHPEQTTSLEVSGASIFVVEEPVSAAGDKIVTINYQVVSLEGQRVSVDGAEVKLLEGGDGSLLIISVQGVPKPHGVFDGMDIPHPPPRPVDGAPKHCGMLPAALCKFKGIMESKLEGFKHGVPKPFGGKGCGGRKGPHRLPGHIKPHFDHIEDLEGEHSGHGKHRGGHPSRPHPHGNHGMGRGPHRHGRPHFLHRFVRAFVSVLVPVIAGITLGMFVSLLGMAVGRLIGFLWIKFRRGGQRGYASVAQAEEQAFPEEKSQVELVEEPLPAYEAAPAYEQEQK